MRLNAKRFYATVAWGVSNSDGYVMATASSVLPDFNQSLFKVIRKRNLKFNKKYKLIASLGFTPNTHDQEHYNTVTVLVKLLSYVRSYIKDQS